MFNRIAIATAQLQTQGIWEFANEQAAQAKTTLLLVTSLIAAVVVVGVLLKTKALIPTALSMLVAALVWFFVNGGLEGMSGTIGETFNASAPSSSLPPGEEV